MREPVLTGRLGLGILIWILMVFAAPTARAVMVRADVSHLADTAHLEFKGLKTWTYEVKREGPKTVTLALPQLDEASMARLGGFSDALIESVKVDKNGPDSTYLVTFNLAQSNVESFDYLTDEPSSLIIDFYTKPNESKPAQAEASANTPQISAAKAATKSKKLKTAKVNGYEKVPLINRKPAGDEFIEVPAPEKTDITTKFGVFDGGDDNYDRFRIKDYEIREDAIISSRQNIYLPFPILKMQVSQLDKLMADKPEYVIHPKDTKENKEARLLLTLYERKRFGVFLKTYSYFNERYPESEYLQILKSIKADVHLQRWKETGKSTEFESARSLYSELVQKYPESPLREHDNLILGFALMERGEALATLQTFEAFLKTYPTSPEIPLVRNAIAEAYIILRKYEEATEEYNHIIRDFPKTPYANEATYRLGDVPFAKGDFSAAIRLYESAIQKLPAQEKIYPNADFNMAEARFWQKDFKKSLNDYIQFLKLFPSNNHGGYALTRIGELLGVLGADQRRIMGAFLESYFRFPNHPGAKVARIRMLAQQMKGMKAKELKRALDEINDYASKLDLEGINEFTTLMSTEGLTNRGEYKESIEKLIAYYQKNPSGANLDRFKSRILRNVANELNDNVEKGEFMKALEFYSQYANTWLNNSGRIDVPIFIAGAYERAGAYSEAEAMYRSALAQRKSIVGTDVEKEKKVQEFLPSVASLHLRLAATLASDRNYIEAYQHLREIGKGDELKPAEVVERVQLNALIAEQRNDTERAIAALTELSQKWNGEAALVAPVNLQLAETQLKRQEYKKAEVHADKVLALDTNAEGNPINDKMVIQAMTAKADAQLGQKQSMAAVETYQKLLDRFEGKLPVANVRYKVGEILYERGDLKGAGDVWKPLQGTKDELLWKLGKEKLEQSKWQADYNKYINRIPAMSASGKTRSPASQKETKR
jgi:tetratricopeptide (TPR) repeat protein